MLAPNAFVRNHYLIVRQVGGGAIGGVYEALDVDNRGHVAVKELDNRASASQRSVFEHRARERMMLHHAALPPATDSFSDGTSAFLITEFIPGDDLATMVLRTGKPFPVGQVLRWAEQLLDVLAFLHANDFPHADIKPQNLKLTPRGQIMMLDIGLVRPMPPQSKPFGDQTISSLQFAPLEQAQGDIADAQSDLFALAGTLYYLLTATLPPLAGQRMNAIRREQTDPLQPAHVLNGSIPEAVSAVFTRALALDSTKRFVDAAAFRSELMRAGTAANPARPPQKPQIVPPTLAVPPALPPVPQKPAAAARPAPQKLVEAPAPAPQKSAAAPKAAPKKPVASAKPAPQKPSATQPLRPVKPVSEPVAPAAVGEMPETGATSGRNWRLPAAIVAGIVVLLVLFLLLRGGSGNTVSQQPTSGPAVALATTGVPTSVVQPTAAPAPTNAPQPTAAPPTAVATQQATAVPSTPVVPAQVAGVEPAALFVGASPLRLVVRGSHLNTIHSARLIADGHPALSAAITPTSAEQVALDVAPPTEQLGGEISYHLELDGVAQEQPAILVRDFVERRTVQGVLAQYDFTNRVATDAAGSYTGMRTEANAESQSVGRLRNGETIDILRTDVDGWYQARLSNGDPAFVGTVGWIERWLVDNQNVPVAPTPAPAPAPAPTKLVFVGRVYSTPTDGAVRCGTAFESSIYGSVENAAGRGIPGARLRIISADGRNVYNLTTGRGGVYSVPGLGCTSWTVSLLSVPNAPNGMQANRVSVRNLNGGRYTSAEVRFRQRG